MSNNTPRLPLPAETDKVSEILLSDGKWYEVGDFSVSNGVVFLGSNGKKDIRLPGDWFSAQALDSSEEHEDGITDHFFTLSGPVSSIVAYRTNHQALLYTD